MLSSNFNLVERLGGNDFLLKKVETRVGYLVERTGNSVVLFGQTVCKTRSLWAWMVCQILEN